MIRKHILVIERRFLGIAEGGCDRVSRHTSDIGFRIRDHDAVLNVEALDFGQSAVGCPVVGQELCDDGELGGRVDHHAGPVEGGVAHAVGVEVAPVWVGGAAVPGGGVGSAARVACAHCLLGGVGRVRGQGCGDAVGFPDVHFCAAGAVVADSRVWVVAGGSPSIYIGLVHGRSAEVMEVREGGQLTWPLMNLRSRGH